MDAEELAKAFEAYEEKLAAAQTNSVPMSILPPDARLRLAKYDESGDNRLDGWLYIWIVY